MRIIAGTMRGRKLVPPADQSIRPTSDKVRGAIFNVLLHAPFAGQIFASGMRVLDLFCGTGALGLEALSRGAASACFVDSHAASLQLARRNAENLQCAEQCSFIKTDATKLPKAPYAFELVFLDPPYGKELAAATLPILLKKGWLANGSLLVIETGKNESAEWGESFALQDRRVYGDTAVCFLKLASI